MPFEVARVIVGSRFGWQAISPEPMDWIEFNIARQLMAEERVGTRVRAAGADEVDDFAASIAALRKG